MSKENVLRKIKAKENVLRQVEADCEKVKDKLHGPVLAEPDSIEDCAGDPELID